MNAQALKQGSDLLHFPANAVPTKGENESLRLIQQSVRDAAMSCSKVLVGAELRYSTSARQLPCPAVMSWWVRFADCVGSHGTISTDACCNSVTNFKKLVFELKLFLNPVRHAIRELCQGGYRDSAAWAGFPLHL